MDRAASWDQGHGAGSGMWIPDSWASTCELRDLLPQGRWGRNPGVRVPVCIPDALTSLSFKRGSIPALPPGSPATPRHPLSLTARGHAPQHRQAASGPRRSPGPVMAMGGVTRSSGTRRSWRRGQGGNPGSGDKLIHSRGPRLCAGRSLQGPFSLLLVRAPWTAPDVPIGADRTARRRRPAVTPRALRDTPPRSRDPLPPSQKQHQLPRSECRRTRPGSRQGSLLPARSATAGSAPGGSGQRPGSPGSCGPWHPAPLLFGLR